MKMPNIAVLPALVTLGNGVCGFAAVALLLRTPLADGTGEAARPLANFTTAGLLVFLAMIFDALDGRVARFARATSDFGGQLDSLCDAVSFGAAPALLAFRLFADSVPYPAFHRLALIVAVLYFACTLLRLARFNVENLHDEEAHMAFRGLPSPAAAGAVASLVVLIVDFRQGDLRGQFGTALVWALPVALMVLGLLMISTIRYAHLLNHLIRGRRPISHVIEIFICIALIWFLQEKALAALFCAYVVSGPAMMAYRKLRLSRVGRAVRGAAADHRDESLRH